MYHIALAVSEREFDRCFPIMLELRPHLLASKFVQQVQRQQQNGYQLAYLDDQELVKAVAGFRLSECLASGKFLYVDDLVTRSSDRSHGYGEALFQWLINYARAHNCQQLSLDSGVQRFIAHRFYFRQRMEITSHHFALKL
ncbi:MAG: GNAT family N-acetyltransferase [Stenomitos rutilans HA7619-LM2]|jgi:GNAT superfamily N-acetyltransferase|nr:GNAT family N-acetyltransferase [Stenomitos rutilans HA7619-LM2]